MADRERIAILQNLLGPTVRVALNGNIIAAASYRVRNVVCIRG
jgi:hypothetical protein